MRLRQQRRVNLGCEDGNAKLQSVRTVKPVQCLSKCLTSTCQEMAYLGSKNITERNENSMDYTDQWHFWNTGADL